MSRKYSSDQKKQVSSRFYYVKNIQQVHQTSWLLQRISVSPIPSSSLALSTSAYTEKMLTSLVTANSIFSAITNSMCLIILMDPPPRMNLPNGSPIWAGMILLGSNGIEVSITIRLPSVAKEVLRRSIHALKEATPKSSSSPKGAIVQFMLASFKKKRFLVSISYLDQPVDLIILWVDLLFLARYLHRAHLWLD